VLKVALSLDGKIACEDGSSQWITGPAARADGHMLRARSQAILVGTGTAVADAPRLTTRLEPHVLDDLEQLAPSAPSLRVLLDRTGKVTSGPLLDTSEAPTLIFTSVEVSAEAAAVWAGAPGVQVCTVPLAEGTPTPELQLTAVRATSQPAAPTALHYTALPSRCPHVLL
jgi:diaminohydroxyphosphoribosylaminopyrimidine deaminase/5-amino-6-(5-phosphoribosylamino)uracil reductase